MRKAAYLLLLLPVLYFLNYKTKTFPSLLPMSLWTHEILYGQIKDIHHPTRADLRMVQRFLRKGQRPHLPLLKDYQEKAQKLRLTGKNQYAKSEWIRSSEKQSENCIILYSSYNGNFPEGQKRFIDALRKTDYQGDILYRVGGWPNVEEGDLTLAHVPYGFKVCLFREAKRLGYKRVLWVDASITPIVSLNQIFSHLGKKGYFIIKAFNTVGPYFNEYAACSLGVSLKESFQIPSCLAGIVGFDFSFEQSCRILDLWYEAAKDSYAYYSSRPEQNALSVILYKEGIGDWESMESIAESKRAISSKSLFLIDRKFVHQWEGISEDL